MRKELKDRWIAALRGGEYKQCRGKLRDEFHVEYTTAAVGENVPSGFVRPSRDSTFAYKNVLTEGVIGHCCLGVLADLVNPNGWQAPFSGGGDGGWHHSYDDGENLLGQETLNYVGLTREEQDTLAQLNDGGCDFAAIAEHIEKEIPCS